ncbi:hypothetical protein [Luteibacter sp.]|nr:hypothetical protein [Luteibacter sp.]
MFYERAQVRRARQRADLVETATMAFAGSQSKEGFEAMTRFVNTLRRLR